MKVLLDERNVVVAIGSGIEYGVWGNVGELSSWKISPTNFMMDNNYTVAEVGNVPYYVMPKRYCYENGEFVFIATTPESENERVEILEERLQETETTMIENYEAQEAINEETESALIEIYQMMEG